MNSNTQKTQQNTQLTRFDFNDKMESLATKMSFMSDAMMYWDVKSIGIESDTQYGFGLIMEDLILEMKTNVEQLEKK